jgi:hypothetical protein
MPAVSVDVLERKPYMPKSRSLAVIGLAVVAATLTGCPGSGGGGGGIQIPSQLDGAMLKFLEARNISVEYALLAGEKLGESQKLKSRITYMKLEGAANAWIEMVSIDVRYGTPPDPPKIQAMQVAASDFVTASQQFADNIDQQFGQSGQTVTAKVGLFDTAGLGLLKTLGDDIQTFQTNAIANEKAMLELRLKEQEMRDKLADQILLCGAWPRWEEIKTPGYAPACTSPGTSPSSR